MYLLTLLVCLFSIGIFCYRLHQNNLMKSKLGRIRYDWSARYNFFSFIGIKNCFIMIFVLSSIVVLSILENSNIVVPYLMIGSFNIAFSVPLKIIIGENGIVFGLHIIDVQKINAWHIIQRRIFCYLCVKSSDTGPSITIPIPKQKVEQLAAWLRQFHGPDSVQSP